MQKNTKQELQEPTEVKDGTGTSEPKTPKKKKRLVKWILSGLFLAGLVTLITIVTIEYLKKKDFYTNHYFLNTRINNIDCSNLDAQTVAEMMDNQAQDYNLTIMGKDAEGNKIELGVIYGKDIAMALTDALSAANDILQAQDERYWFEAYDGAHYGYSIVQGVVFEEELLRKQVESFEAFREENMLAPANAYIGGYNAEKNEYEMVAEVNGTQFDVDEAISCIKTAIYGNAATVDLVEQGLYSMPRITAENKILLSNLNKVNQWLKTDITYDWNSFEVKLDKALIRDWITVEKNYPVLNEAAVAEFVAKNAAQYDTYGKNRKFVTTLGVELSLPSGAFGWKTDREAETKQLLQLIKKGTVVKREPVYSHKAPWKGMNDIGNSYVEADITNQHLYLYHKGTLVLETDFVSGDMSVSNNITPPGVFGVTYKTTNAVLRGADYETPVSYWMPYHGNFGMHDATWRTEFGGDFYITGQGSHGCLNLPLDKAEVIYNYVYTGHPVICYYY